MPRAARFARAAERFARRRRPHLVLGCAVTGLGLAPAPPQALAAAGLVAGGLAGLLLGSRAAVLVAAILVGSAALGTARLDAIDRPARAAPPGSVVDADATLLEHPRSTRFGSSGPVRIDSGPASGLRVLARAGHEAWPGGGQPGSRMRLRGLVRDASRSAPSQPGAASTASEANAGRPGTPGFGPIPDLAVDDGFDYGAFLRSRRIGRELKVESMRPAGTRGGLAGVIDGIRRRAERAIGIGLSPDRAALARGMVLGEDGDIADEVRDDFQRSGLAHVLAASGQNVMLLCALAMPLLMFGGAGPRVRVAVLLALVVLYVPLAGASASVERAGLMAAAGLVAMAAGRPASAAYSLLLAAAATLGVNPRATGDPGWQLSFAAVGGMLLLGPLVRRRMPQRLPRALREGVGATVAASVATAPLMAHQFGAVSVAALPANILALPAIAPVMWVGMTQAALAQLAPLGRMPGAIADALAGLGAPVADLGLGWVAWIAGRLAEPGWAQASVDLRWPGVACAYLAIAAAAALAARSRDASGARPSLEGMPGELIDRLRALPPPKRRAGAVLIAALGLAVLTAWWQPPASPRHLTVDFLDVGQGDATLIRDPAGAAVLFDGGPPEARVDRLLRRLGVRRLSIVVATHQSRDHHGGLAQVIRRIPVGLLLDGGDGTRDPTYLAVLREARTRGVRTVAVRSGQVLRAGGITIRILAPAPRPPGPAPANPNARATVAVVSEGGFGLFLSADAESPSLLGLDLPPVDAMKVPHHGSADPGLPALLERLRPRVAAIEVGRGNSYGHPRRPSLDALRGRVPNVYRTDRDGTVELTVGQGEVAVRTHR